MGSRKSMRSMDAVTHDMREWRIAATAVVLSIMARIAPPKMWPRLLASCGSIISDDSCCDSRTAFVARVALWVTGWRLEDERTARRGAQVRWTSVERDGLPCA